MKIEMSYGSGGIQTNSLIQDIFLKNFDNKILNKLEDAAIVSMNGKIAYTTDTFIVTPLFFYGGDIGKLAVYGTINDLSMMGAIPKYITAGFVIEEGTEIETLERIANSMAMAAKETKVKIVAGDTKVLEGNGGIYITTSGIGEIVKRGVSIYNAKIGDVIILSGNLGDHHATILSHRMGIENNIVSDCAPLHQLVQNLISENISIHCMRDITRGGLASILHDVSANSSCKVVIKEDNLPISKEVKEFCLELNIDPLYMSNEGKMIAVVPKNQGEKALKAIQKSRYGKNAKIIGTIEEGSGVSIIDRNDGLREVAYLDCAMDPRLC